MVATVNSDHSSYFFCESVVLGSNSTLKSDIFVGLALGWLRFPSCKKSQYFGGKILIFGATGAVGSSLAKLLNGNSNEIHLIGKNETEVSRLSEETGGSFSVADVTDPSFIEKIDSDLK